MCLLAAALYSKAQHEAYGYQLETADNGVGLYMSCSVHQFKLLVDNSNLYIPFSHSLDPASKVMRLGWRVKVRV